MDALQRDQRPEWDRVVLIGGLMRGASFCAEKSAITKRFEVKSFSGELLGTYATQGGRDEPDMPLPMSFRSARKGQPWADADQRQNQPR